MGNESTEGQMGPHEQAHLLAVERRDSEQAAQVTTKLREFINIAVPMSPGAREKVSRSLTPEEWNSFEILYEHLKEQKQAK